MKVTIELTPALLERIRDVIDTDWTQEQKVLAVLKYGLGKAELEAKEERARQAARQRAWDTDDLPF